MLVDDPRALPVRWSVLCSGYSVCITLGGTVDLPAMLPNNVGLGHPLRIVVPMAIALSSNAYTSI